MKLPYWHVDAFADRPFKGNQAAVMPLDSWLPDTVLQRIGEENNFAETAFLVKDASGEADWELRWFTPEVEIRLCGHATLASGHVLLERDGGERVTFRTRQAGVLEVRRSGSGYELALPCIPTARSEWPEAVALLGAQPSEVWRSDDRYGVYLFDSEAQVRALAPDVKGLGARGESQIRSRAAARLCLL
ncbi:MAG: PhzF family phenazine biosynthesis protein, partial [Tsuneonella sp.]